MPCLKIVKDLAADLLFIHQSHSLAHGNLKASNVLLGPDFASCLMDYCLTCFQDLNSLEERSAASLFYKTPECHDPASPTTLPSDIYCCGLFLLELLTGKTPFQDLVREHGSDILRLGEIRAGGRHGVRGCPDPTSSNEVSEEGAAQHSDGLHIQVPGNRQMEREVMKMIRDARSEAQVSSNNGKQSPGRWSDTS